MAHIIFKDSDFDKKVKSGYPKSIKWKIRCLISLGINLILIGIIIYSHART